MVSSGYITGLTSSSEVVRPVISNGECGEQLG